MVFDEEEEGDTCYSGDAACGGDSCTLVPAESVFLSDWGSELMRVFVTVVVRQCTKEEFGEITNAHQ